MADQMDIVLFFTSSLDRAGRDGGSLSQRAKYSPESFRIMLEGAFRSQLPCDCVVFY